jgi:serine/threonine protein phosphatase 1
MSDLPWSIEHRDYLFVHAGLDRNMPFETQVRILRERDYTLSHPAWLYSKDFIIAGPPMDSPVTIVVGHVPLPQVRFGNGMITTDTTGGTSGELSCVLLPEKVVFQSGNARPQPVTTDAAQRPWWKMW